MSRGWQSGWQQGWQFGQHPGKQDGPPPSPPLQLWWGQAPRPAADVAPTTPTTPIRIGDAERDKAVSDLGDHFAAGRLNREEFDDRADQAMQARFSTELAPLFADLPETVPAAPAAPSGAVRAGGPPPWAYAMWLFPVLMVAAVAGAILLHAPFILWLGVWLLVIGRITGHKHRHRREQQRHFLRDGVSRPGLR
ncbi:MAG TPA: DUF1707 domain-containing protein [Microlunatus sp.]